MKSIALSDAARQELRDIYAYTAERWGAAQAVRYVTGFDTVFARLCDGSAVTRSADVVGPGLRKVTVGRHVVFFREDAAAVTVVRVLHERIDMGRV